MPVTLHLRDVPPGLELRLREAIDSELDGNWCVTVSRSHLDGQWYLQLDGVAARCCVPLPSTSARVRDLEALLRHLTRRHDSGLHAHDPALGPAASDPGPTSTL